MFFHALSNRKQRGLPHTGMPHKMMPDLPWVTTLTRSSCRSTYLRSKGMKASLYDNHINLEGFRYFVGHASDVLFGAYGQKKNSLIPGNPPYL